MKKIEDLYKTFKVDFDLFDYNIPDYLKHWNKFFILYQ